jgi:6-aminohexanoate-oligomer endohydrolase
MVSNDQLQLEPDTDCGDKILEFELEGLQTGVAQYREGPTGCTVFYFPEGALTAIDIRGGSVGTTGNHKINHAICLAGGSSYGLEAACGVATALFARRKYSKRFQDIALVSGAIIYDYGLRDNAIYPDKLLGRAAFEATTEGRFAMGRVGAGCSATVGNGFDSKSGEFSGQTAAFTRIGETRIALFSVVNAIGAIVDRKGGVVLGHRDKNSGKRFHLRDDLNQRLAGGAATTPVPGNTTLTVMVTNQKMSDSELQQVGRQVHASMARVIQPFHTQFDGDLFYAVSTGKIDNPDLTPLAIGVFASELAADALLKLPGFNR